jgi:Chaperone of endosialidase
MDKYRKALLGAAGLLALTASGEKSANAAIPPDDATTKVDKVSKAAGYSAYADPLFELMKRTNGSFGKTVVESALREMLADPAPAQVEAMPMLLAGLERLGAPSDVVTRSRDVLIELVSNASNIGDDLKDSTETKLHQGHAGNVKLAAVHRRRKRIPDEVGQVGHTVPSEIGQTGGGASSDIRVKHDIARVGRLENGLGLYRFSYIGSDKVYVGVMAQEVETVMPEAVVRGSDGYLRVYYDKLGIRMKTWEEWVASGQNIQVTRH